MKLKLYYSNKQDKFKISLALKRIIRKAVKGALTFEEFPYNAEVSITFTDNEGIRDLNREFRDKDSPTDVLSFPMYNFLEGDEPADSTNVELGDIVISLERAKSQAEDFGHSFKREVAFLTVHSVLHLIGYDHELSEEDEKEMFFRQDKIMDFIKISRD